MSFAQVANTTEKIIIKFCASIYEIGITAIYRPYFGLRLPQSGTYLPLYQSKIPGTH